MKFISLILVLTFSVACSSNRPTQSKINALEVTEKLEKGKTTQAKVLEDFGTPDIVEKTPEGDMWAYNRRANESESVGGDVSHYGGYFLSYWSGASLGAESSSSSTKTASLILYFGPNKVLKTYTFRTERF
jgi:hypothetical protein